MCGDPTCRCGLVRTAPSPVQPDVQGEALEFIKALVGAWDCCGTCAGGVLARYTAKAEAAGAAKGWDEAHSDLCSYRDWSGNCYHAGHVNHYRATLAAPDLSADEGGK